jgi:hypothetical protein
LKAKICFDWKINGMANQRQPDMTSERQIAANRRNAAKSTGPRSPAAKKRVSRNAYRHGLSSNVIWSKKLSKQLHERARSLVSNSQDPLTLERARAVAEAELDIACVRRAKVSLIERISAFGALDPPQFTSRGIIRWLRAYERGIDLPPSFAMAGVPPAMPPEGPERSTEAIRRALPELLKLDRYERRAAARRDRAVRDICEARKKP